MISVFIATTLDGFLARSNGAFDFLPDAPEDHGYDAFIAGIDALVMGRNTFDAIAPYPWPYAARSVFVLTHRPIAPSHPGHAHVEAIAGAPADIVRQLAARNLHRLYIDGGVTIQQFLRAGLVHRILLTRVPVLIGQGIPLFGSLPHDVPLRHIATRTFPSGLVTSEYHLN